MRLDIYLAQYWPEQSRSQWQKLCKAGHVTVNGEVVTSTKFELGEDDAVAVNVPAAPDHSDEVLPVLYSDENVMVINKPAGILTHAKGAQLNEFSVAEFMRRHMAPGEETGNRPGIVHRLDRDTSGIIIGARNEATRTYLQKQFSQRTVKKKYLALVDGILAQDEAIIQLPIERNPKKPSTFRVGASGKSAETRYRVLWRNEKQCLVELAPLTGRTHQLRVHLAHLGAPIAGDRVYNQAAQQSARLGLHAFSLELTLPGGIRKVFTTPPPKDFRALLPSDALEALDGFIA